MLLAARLNEDLKKALKAGNKDTVSVIRLIKAAVKNKEIEKGGALGDDEIQGVMKTQSRQMKDSIEQFSKAGRSELVEKEKKELSIVESYMPEQLTEEELSEKIREVIKETGASGPGDLGKVMKAVLAQVKGQADGRMVSEIVKRTLS